MVLLSTPRVSAVLLMVLAMTSTLLFGLVISEGEAIKFYMMPNHENFYDGVRQSLATLKQVVGVLHVTLALLILTACVLVFTQLIWSRWRWLTLIVLALMVAPALCGIVWIDLVAVIVDLHTVQPTDAFSVVHDTLFGTVFLHVVGVLGFTTATIAQALYTLALLSEDAL